MNWKVNVSIFDDVIIYFLSLIYCGLSNYYGLSYRLLFNYFYNVYFN